MSYIERLKPFIYRNSNAIFNLFQLVRTCRKNIDLNSLVSLYNSTLTTLLDKYAPLIEISITVCPQVPWFNDNIKLSNNAINMSTYRDQVDCSLIG